MVDCTHQRQQIWPSGMNQQYYLHHIGIQRWQMQRPRTGGDFVDNVYEGMLGADSGLILADATTQLEQKNEMDLFCSIVKATKLAESGCFVTEWSRDAIKPDIKVIIALGPRVSEFLSHTPQPFPAVISSHSLKDLLDNSALKAETWQSIKQAMQLMR